MRLAYAVSVGPATAPGGSGCTCQLTFNDCLVSVKHSYPFFFFLPLLLFPTPCGGYPTRPMCQLPNAIKV